MDSIHIVRYVLHVLVYRIYKYVYTEAIAGGMWCMMQSVENALDFEETSREDLTQYFLLPDRDSLAPDTKL